MTDTKPAKLTAAAKLSVPCPLCGRGIGELCRTAPGSVSKDRETISMRFHSDRIALARETASK